MQSAFSGEPKPDRILTRVVAALLLTLLSYLTLTAPVAPTDSGSAKDSGAPGFAQVKAATAQEAS